MDPKTTLSYPEVLLSSIQVQQMLGLSRTSVWRLTRRGLLLPVHIGAALRFRRSDVLALMQVGTSQHPTQKSPPARA
jgi:predicted DNA-binding transcriptional regulator AlpA